MKLQLSLLVVLFAVSCAVAGRQELRGNHEQHGVRRGRQSNGVYRQPVRQAGSATNEDGSSGAPGFMQHLASLLADRPQQSYSDVTFNSRLGQFIAVGMRMIRTQAEAFSHLMRALAPIDTLLADQNWRSAQTAAMRQESASTFNMILDLVLRFVRVLMSVFGEGTRALAAF